MARLIIDEDTGGLWRDFEARQLTTLEEIFQGERGSSVPLEIYRIQVPTDGGAPVPVSVGYADCLVVLNDPLAEFDSGHVKMTYGTGVSEPVDVFKLDAEAMEGAFNSLEALATLGGLRVEPEGRAFVVTMRRPGFVSLTPGVDTDHARPFGGAEVIPLQAGGSGVRAQWQIRLGVAPVARLDSFSGISGGPGGTFAGAAGTLDLATANLAEFIARGHRDFQLSVRENLELLHRSPLRVPDSLDFPGTTGLPVVPYLFYFEGQGVKQLQDVKLDGLTYDGVTLRASAGAPTFLSMPDTPASYAGEAGKVAAVNQAEDALEFIDAGGGSGDVTGPGSAVQGNTSIFADTSGKVIADSGRNAANDGTKLDGIEAGATGDQTGAEIKTLYEAEADTNAFTDAEKTKLAGVEDGADVTDEDNVTDALDGATLAQISGAGGDGVLIQDASDGNTLKKVDWAALPGAGGGDGDMTKAVYDPAGINEQLVGLTAAQDLFNKRLASPTADGLLLDQGLAGSPEGVLTVSAGSVILARTDAGLYEPGDGALEARTGQVVLYGSGAQVEALKGTGNREVRVAADGSLYAVDPPPEGWLETDTDTGSYDLGTGTGTGADVELTGLGVTVPAAGASPGDRVDISGALWVVNKTGNRTGNLEIGFGIDAGTPPNYITFPIAAGFAGYIVYGITVYDVTLTSGQAINIHARISGGSNPAYGLDLVGTPNNHSLAVEQVQAGSGGGIGAVVEDPAPVLGGDLSVGSGPFSIYGAAVNIGNANNDATMATFVQAIGGGDQRPAIRFGQELDNSFAIRLTGTNASGSAIRFNANPTTFEAGVNVLNDPLNMGGQNIDAINATSAIEHQATTVQLGTAYVGERAAPQGNRTGYSQIYCPNSGTLPGRPQWVLDDGTEFGLLHYELGMACSDETSDLAAGAAKFKTLIPTGFVFTRLYAQVNTAPTGSALIIDVNLNLTTILSAPLQIAAGGFSNETASFAVADCTKGQSLTVDIDQIGATVAGAGLKVYLVGYRKED